MTINVSAKDGDALPFTFRGVDRGAGSAASVAGRSVTLTHHDDLWKAAWDTLYAVGVTKNFLSSTVSASGDTTLAAVPGAGNRFSIPWLHLQNESATEVTVRILSGTTERYRAVLSAKGTADSFRVAEFPVHMPLETIANQALVIHLSGAGGNPIGYSLAYHIRS